MQLWMLGGGSLTSLLVYLEMSMTLEFFETLNYIDKLNIRGFSIWWKLVKKVFHFTFLVIKDTCCSCGSSQLTRKDNNILCLSSYIIKNINKGDQLWKMPLTFKIKPFESFCTKLTLIAFWFYTCLCVVVFFTIWFLVKGWHSNTPTFLKIRSNTRSWKVESTSTIY